MNAANTAPAALPVSFEFFPPKTPEGIEKFLVASMNGRG